MNRTLIVLLGSLLLACVVVGAAEESTLELLPRGRPFRLTFADPREIRMALDFVGDQRIDAAIGNYFSFFAIHPTGAKDLEFHLGIEGAGYFTMRKVDSRFPLETADGLIGAYFEGNYGPIEFQTRYTHISAHLADGSDRSAAIPYSREMLINRIGYVIPKYGQVYAGIHYLAHSIPVLPPVSYQFGADGFLPLRGSKITPFAGFDLQWGPAMPYSPSLNVQLGIALNNPPEAYRSFRILYQYYTGTDPRGQFYNQAYTAHLFGIEMQI